MSYVCHRVPRMQIRTAIFVVSLNQLFAVVFRFPDSPYLIAVVSDLFHDMILQFLLVCSFSNPTGMLHLMTKRSCVPDNNNNCYYRQCHPSSALFSRMSMAVHLRQTVLKITTLTAFIIRAASTIGDNGINRSTFRRLLKPLRYVHQRSLTSKSGNLMS